MVYSYLKTDQWVEMVYFYVSPDQWVEMVYFYVIPDQWVEMVNSHLKSEFPLKYISFNKRLTVTLIRTSQPRMSTLKRIEDWKNKSLKGNHKETNFFSDSTKTSLTSFATSSRVLKRHSLNINFTEELHAKFIVRH